MQHATDQDEGLAKSSKRHRRLNNLIVTCMVTGSSVLGLCALPTQTLEESLLWLGGFVLHLLHHTLCVHSAFIGSLRRSHDAEE